MAFDRQPRWAEYRGTHRGAHGVTFPLANSNAHEATRTAMMSTEATRTAWHVERTRAVVRRRQRLHPVTRGLLFHRSPAWSGCPHACVCTTHAGCGRPVLRWPLRATALVNAARNGPGGRVGVPPLTHAPKRKLCGAVVLGPRLPATSRPRTNDRPRIYVL